MKVTIRNIENPEDEQVIIQCIRVTPEIEEIRAFALNKGIGVYGVGDDIRMERLPLDTVYYFEAVDEKVFAYTDSSVYEIKQRLYEVESAYMEHYFMRCSKSVVLNLMKLKDISPALNGRYKANMKNGESLMISRKYASSIIRRVMD